MASSTYKDIAKSTSIVASVQVVQMIFSLIRNKVISLVVGTSGFGIWSLYTTFFELLGSFSMLGLDQSAVREIAKNSEDSNTTAKIISSFKKVVLLTTAITLIIAIVFSKQISCYLFDSSKYQIGIVIISCLLFFRTVSRIWYVILNGLRKLKELALSQIISTIAGSVLTITVVCIWKTQSIAVAIGLVSVGMAIIPYLYVKRIGLPNIKVSLRNAIRESKDMLKLGIGFTIAGIISTIMTFMGKSYLSNNFNISDVGLYQASWTISSLYIGMILTAMGVDFMPRLSKVANDNKAASEMINQQILFGVVLGSIGVIGILLFSKILLYFIYSSEFYKASIIIRWHVLGVFLRVLAFPFSYAIMAKGKATGYAIIQTIFWVLEYFLLVFFGNKYGYDGLGVNYLVAYICYLTLSASLTIHYYHFRPTLQLIRIIAFISTVIFISFFWSSYSDTNNFIYYSCLIYTSDAADDLTRVYLGCRRIIKKKK